MIDGELLRPRAPRIPFDSAVHLAPLHTEGPVRRFEVANLSEGGMFVHDDTPLIEGTRVSVRMESNGRPLPFAEGIVVWRRPKGLKGQLSGFGIQFVRFLNPRAQALLRSLVERVHAAQEAAAPLPQEAPSSSPPPHHSPYSADAQASHVAHAHAPTHVPRASSLPPTRSSPASAPAVGPAFSMPPMQGRLPIPTAGPGPKRTEVHVRDSRIDDPELDDDFEGEDEEPLNEDELAFVAEEQERQWTQRHSLVVCALIAGTIGGILWIRSGTGPGDAELPLDAQSSAAAVAPFEPPLGDEGAEDDKGVQVAAPRAAAEVLPRAPAHELPLPQGTPPVLDEDLDTAALDRAPAAAPDRVTPSARPAGTTVAARPSAPVAAKPDSAEPSAQKTPSAAQRQPSMPAVATPVTPSAKPAHAIRAAPAAASTTRSTARPSPKPSSVATSSPPKQTRGKSRTVGPLPGVSGVSRVELSSHSSELRILPAVASGARVERTFSLDGPPRVVIDLSGPRPAKALQQSISGVDGVRSLRVGIRPEGGTRLVLDLTRRTSSKPQARQGAVVVRLR